MAWTSVPVEQGTKSRLEWWAQKYDVDLNTIIKTLLDMADSPYNRNLIEHLINLKKLSTSFDKAMDQDERAQIASQIQEAAKKSKEFL